MLIARCLYKRPRACPSRVASCRFYPTRTSEVHALRYISFLRPLNNSPSTEGKALFLQYDGISGSFKEKKTKSGPLSVLFDDRRRPEIWAQLLDKYLPQSLKTTPGTSPYVKPENQSNEICTILKAAGKPHHASVNLFAWLVLNGRKKAALYLMSQLLQGLPSIPVDKPRTPSNISWPQNSYLEQLTRNPIELNALEYTNVDRIITGDATRASESVDSTADPAHFLLDTIWKCLGQLIIQSANASTEESFSIISVVLLVFGQIHSLNYIPEKVYSYHLSSYSSTTRRPPILHLLSSRILTALSDTAWREYQADLVDQAQRLGTKLKDIGRDPPGGRFRLKVRPLGPEAWLEFVLWCCIESGHNSAAVSIMKMLSEQIENPWFAVGWTANKHEGPKVDWNRVKTRHGGAVGLIEGYSREKPFVEIPPKTISVEVVLALVESIVSSIEVGDGSVGALKRTHQDIKTVLSFLEPHNLPTNYFDTLSVRIQQTGHYESIQKPGPLASWVDTLSYLKSLERVNSKTFLPMALAFDSIVGQSELQAGMLHQVLDLRIQNGDIHRSLKVFNDIQKQVDGSKLNAIGSFLRTPRNMEDFFSARPFESRLEYVNSHGQLPNYKLGGFLNLVTDTNMTGLGQWLLYADDVDGPIIPESAYSVSSLTSPLIRFAAVSEDENLLKKVISSRQKSSLLPSVTTLRNMINALISLNDFESVTKQLRLLKTATAGGYNITNIAHLGAAILKLERTRGDEDLPALRQAVDVMDAILRGDFESIRSDFTTIQKITFKQMMAQLLRVFEHCGGSVLQTIARSHLHRLPSSSTVDLPVSAYNTVLGAIIEKNGALQGLQMWQTFCKEPGSEVFPRKDEDEIAFDFDSEMNKPLLVEGFTQRQPLTLDGSLSPLPLVQTWEGQPSNQFNSTMLTSPDLRTLRLIVRAAVAEKQQLVADGEATNEQDRILQWATQTFKLFNAPPVLIEQEILEPFIAVQQAWQEETRVSLPQVRLTKVRGGGVESSFLGKPFTRRPGMVRKNMAHR